MSAVATPPHAAAADAAAAARAELLRLRDRIEAVDRQLIGLIAERVQLALAVGTAKEAAGLPILDPPREAAVVRRAGALAREAGLDDEEVRRVFWQVVGLSRRAQTEPGPAPAEEPA